MIKILNLCLKLRAPKFCQEIVNLALICKTLALHIFYQGRIFIYLKGGVEKFLGASGTTQ
jgi:hypothetical protein